MKLNEDIKEKLKYCRKHKKIDIVLGVINVKAIHAFYIFARKSMIIYYIVIIIQSIYNFVKFFIC